MSEHKPYQTQEPSSATTAAAETAQQVAPETTAKAQEIGDRMQHEAQRLAQEATDKGQEMIQDQKHAMADQIGVMANALHTTAEELKTQDHGAMAQYTQQAADGLERFSQTLKDHDLGTLVGHVEDFARNQPGAFIGSAALLGFMAARFLKSSSERRSTPSPDAPTHHAYVPARTAFPSQPDMVSSSTTDSSVGHRAIHPSATTPTHTPRRGDN